jgi:ferric-dicitrate binding protein FerR (iron transport regulator)
VPADDDDLQRFAASNRAKIENLEREMDRVRDRLHEHGDQLAAMMLLLSPLRQLPKVVDDLRMALDRLSRRAVERPGAAGLGATAAWVSVVIAFAALLVVIFRG